MVYNSSFSFSINFASNSLKRLKTLINSIMVGHAFKRYYIDPSTLPNALIICCITPRVITPATIAGAKNT